MTSTGGGARVAAPGAVPRRRARPRRRPGPDQVERGAALASGAPRQESAGSGAGRRRSRRSRRRSRRRTRRRSRRRRDNGGSRRWESVAGGRRIRIGERRCDLKVGVWTEGRGGGLWGGAGERRGAGQRRRGTRARGGSRGGSAEGVGGGKAIAFRAQDLAEASASLPLPGASELLADQGYQRNMASGGGLRPHLR